MTTTLKTYPEYKDTNIEWVKNIPNDWGVNPLRYCCFENTKKNNRLLNTEILSLSYGKVILKDTDKNFGLVPESYSSYQILYPGDIVMRLTDLQNDHVSLRTGLVKNEGIITSAYLGLKIRRDRLDDRFFHWLLHSYDLQKVFYGMGGGIRQTVGFKDLKWLPILTPNIETQKNIANYLDEKTKVIDELVSKKEKMIKLLREKRSSLITQAVTKGLDSKAKMKDSGVEWLGEIPTEWRVKKIKFTSSIQASNIDKKSYVGENDVLLCNYVDVYKNEYINSSMPFMDATATNEQIKKLGLKVGDVVITKDSETPDDIGVPAFVKTSIKNLVCGYHLYLIRPTNKELIGEYLFRFLQSNPVKGYFETCSSGVTRFGLGAFGINNIPVALPPLEEQKSLTYFLWSETTKIERATKLIKSQIDQLKEYRSSLIYSAVTGKIKV